MDVSVIFTTYNSPDCLAKVIWGWYAQTDRDFELIVADDGSTDETRKRIDHLRNETGMAIEHIWQEDRGFRKTRILNKAVEAGAEYLIFSDGDCIPRDDFVAEHRKCAAPGRFLSGGRFTLPAELSQEITREDILQQRIFDVRWLRARRVPLGTDILKLKGKRFAAVLNALTPTKPTWNGANSSGWKHDLLAVNGFNERMTYGGEDREMGYRLANTGIRPFQMRYNTVCAHMDHERPYAGADVVAENRRAMLDTQTTGRTWTPHGIVPDG